MVKYILGIDIGTGSTKCVAMNLTGDVLGTAQHHYGINHPEQGFSEQDPELIWQAFVKCISDIVATIGTPPLTISLSSAMHSVIPIDENGNAITDMITWADVRSESIANEIKNSADGERIYRLTGTPIHPMSPLCKLIWLRENQSDLFKRANKFISIKGYIWYKLFKQFEIDYSLASATGLFDIQNLCWSKDICDFAGVTSCQLSIPVNTNYSRMDMDPDIAVLLGLAPDTVFVIGASDGCCANLGSFVNSAGTAALTIGTSGAVRVTGDKPIYDFNAMTFNYLLDEKTFVSGGAVNNGGNALDWLLGNFLNKPTLTIQDYSDLFKAIETVPAGSNGLLFLPYLYGERAPIWDAKSTGAFLNIRPVHHQQHFLRAALEGICYALNDVLASLEQSPVKITQINVSGGFISSEVWLQILADITGKELFVLQLEDASAIGAVYLAMKTHFPDISYPNPDPAKTRVIKPDFANHQVYTTNFIIYKKVYQSIKDSMDLFDTLN